MKGKVLYRGREQGLGREPGSCGVQRLSGRSVVAWPGLRAFELWWTRWETLARTKCCDLSLRWLRVLVAPGGAASDPRLPTARARWLGRRLGCGEERAKAQSWCSRIFAFICLSCWASVQTLGGPSTYDGDSQRDVHPSSSHPRQTLFPHHLSSQQPLIHLQSTSGLF